jgi:acetyl-CoA synthetase
MSGEYAWIPDEQTIEQANSTRFARSHGYDSFDALVDWSVTDLEGFWDAATRHLAIPFDEPYARVMNQDRGMPWTTWFEGGRLNMTQVCVHQWADGPHADVDALRFEAEDGTARSLTYRELAAEVSRCAGALRGLGIGEGDRVALMMPMTIEAVVGFYAIAAIGAIIVPIFSGFATPAVQVRLEDGGVRAVLTASHLMRRGKRVPLRDTVAEACAAAPTVETVIVHGGTGGDVALDATELDWDAWMAAAEPIERPVPVDAEHRLMVCFTSGTTGRPKGAVHVHGGFTIKTAIEVYFQADVKDGDVLFWLSDMGWIMAPWFIVGGHACGVTVGLFDGAPDFPGPDRLWEFVERQGVTFMGVSPTLIRALQAHGVEQVRKHDISSLRVWGSAGEPWNPAPYHWLMDEVGEGTRPIINLSGGTEVASSFLSCDVSIPIKPCSLGRPALGMAIDVYDPDGASLTGVVGELICTQPWPSMTRGLWQADDRYVETYWERYPGVWTHGDWAMRDEDGAWFLFGRSDDTLNVAGKRIGSAEYESALVGHPDVVEACVVGIPHALKGETAWGFVILQPGCDLDELRSAELAGMVDTQIGKAFRAERIYAVSILPKTRSGKIVRRAVRAIILGEEPGDLSTLEDPAALDAIRDLVASDPR